MRIGALLIGSFAATFCAAALAAWTPPADPDPGAILTEARQDAAAGRYADALEKHLWIHHKSLQYDSAFSGVRLSFALAQWRDLGNVYPPAAEALKSLRDDVAVRVRSGPAAADAFADLVSVNRVLHDDIGTADAFAWLDANRPQMAKQQYMRAQDALVVTRNYALCGKYIDTPAEIDRITSLYRLPGRASNPELAKFMRNSFRNRAATLVALLAVNGRKAEAETAREEFLKELQDDDFRAQLNQAAAGVVPEPWPRGL